MFSNSATVNELSWTCGGGSRGDEVNSIVCERSLAREVYAVRVDMTWVAA